MTTSRHSRLRDAFVLRDDDIKKFWELFERRFQNITAVAEFRDDLEEEYSSIESLLLIENTTTRPVTALAFEAESEGNRAQIRFDDNCIRVQFSFADAGEARSWNDALEERLMGIKPWYGRLSSRHLWPQLALLVTSLSFFVVLELKTFHALAGVEVGGLHADIIALGIFIAISTFVSCVIGNGRIQNAVFPGAVFALGQGKERFERGLIVRRWLLGFLAATALAYVARMVVGFL